MYQTVYLTQPTTSKKKKFNLLFRDSCLQFQGNFSSALRIARAGLEIANTPGQTVKTVGYDKVCFFCERLKAHEFRLLVFTIRLEMNACMQDLRCIAGLSLHGLGRFLEVRYRTHFAVVLLLSASV